MSVSLLVPGAGDALDVGEPLLQGLLAGRGQAGLAEHGGQVGFFGEPGRGVGGGDGGVAAAGGVEGADERGLAALAGREGVLAFGLGGVPQAVVDGAEVQAGELVAEQGDLGSLIGVLGVQGRGAAEGCVDVVEPGVQACRAGPAATAWPSRRACRRSVMRRAAVSSSWLPNSSAQAVSAAA